MDKVSLFNLWTIVAILASFFQILASFIAITQLDFQLIDYQSLCGLGCMLAWINITRYIEYSRQSAVFINTFTRSLPYVLRFLVGVFPLFMGYVFLGIALFWNSKRFASPSGAMVTLFAVLNGDMVYDTFHDLQIINIVIAQVYLYTFVMLFINVVQNVFITIVEDGFISVKYRENYHHILHQPERGQVDFRQVQEDKEKIGDISIGATGQYHGPEQIQSTPFISSGGVSKEIERDHPKMQKQAKKRQKEYKSKMALHRIVQGGLTFQRRGQKGNLLSPSSSTLQRQGRGDNEDDDQGPFQWNKYSRMRKKQGPNKEEQIQNNLCVFQQNQREQRIRLNCQQNQLKNPKIWYQYKREYLINAKIYPRPHQFYWQYNIVYISNFDIDEQIFENFKSQLRLIKKTAQQVEDKV